MKVSELDGAMLDYWVAKADGMALRVKENGWIYFDRDIGGWLQHTTQTPSTNWADGGPIIEREKIELRLSIGLEWCALCGDRYRSGPTPLIAAMRAFVASKFGEEVSDEN